MISLTILLFSLLVCLILSVSLCFADANLDEITIKNDTRYRCETDRDCGESEYCLSKQYCVKCVSCIKYFRLKQKQRCARTMKDCGPCMPGYVDDSTGPQKLYCMPLVTLAQPRIAESPDEFTKIVENYNWIGIASIGFLAATAFISWRCYRKKKTASMISDTWHEMGLEPHLWSNSNNNCGTSLPPPAYDDSQTTSSSDNGSVAYSFNLRITEHPETKTNAVPFQLPFGEHIIGLAPPSYENSAETNENLADVPVEQSEPDHPSASNANIDIHDEATQPSLWIPGPSYLMAQTDETDSTTAACTDKKDEKITPPSKRRKVEDLTELNDS